MGEALEMIRAGRADAMVTGGTEAGLSELGLAAFQIMKALSTSNDPPDAASRPFDSKRDGFVSSEGAAVFVVESLEHAKQRGAPILAEFAGYGCTSDAHHVVVPVEDGETTAACMTMALEDAGLRPEDVDYVNAHATSTQMNDKYETIALKRALGEYAYEVPISATKSLIGHTLGASAAIESVACVQSILTGKVHPTINQEFPDPDCDLDYVPNTARDVDVDVVLKNSFGFGGQNACLVFRKYAE
jgi:3-oxoacyl-[acyl-carrier-protein] synthase II